MSKKVSVIIPVYNVENYLEECLDSVFQQSYSNYEVIAVNDGSKDGSLELLNAYAKKEARLRVVSKENGGLSDARNFGLNYAQGEYVLFIDGDDRIHPEMIALLVEKAETTQSEIVVCDMEYFYEDGRKEYSSGGNFTTTNIKETPSLITINNSACNKLYRINLFDDVKFPVGMYYEDLATIPILLYKAKAVSKVDQPLYQYRQRGGSIAHSVNDKIFDIYDAMDLVRDYVKMHGKEPEVLKEINHLYLIHGLDLTTLRIKDAKEKDLRESYLMRNMDRLEASYPNYKQDDLYRNVGIKKRIIYHLLSKRKMKQVLRIYG